LLLLFKPWRRLETLRGDSPTWLEALNCFMKLCGSAPVCEVTYAKHAEEEGDELRIRLIRHTITLAKSKADAEQERRERQAEADERGKNQYRERSEADPDGSRSDGQSDVDDGAEENATITTTIKRYLKYDNPFLYSLMRAHRYVVEAIYTGQTCGILPSISTVDQLLAPSNFTPVELRINLRRQSRETITPSHFNLPHVVSVDTQKLLSESIKTRLTTKRQVASTTALRSCADWDTNGA
jgi:hypothetical protein